MTRLPDSAAPGQVSGRPLAGLRVVECATFVAGPSAGMSMAQLGADVIRIDPPRGASEISLGHPVGATGGRILATLLRELDRRQARYALETMCIGGGQGLAAVFQRWTA